MGQQVLASRIKSLPTGSSNPQRIGNHSSPYRVSSHAGQQTAHVQFERSRTLTPTNIKRRSMLRDGAFLLKHHRELAILKVTISERKISVQLEQDRRLIPFH